MAHVAHSLGGARLRLLAEAASNASRRVFSLGSCAFADASLTGPYPQSALRRPPTPPARRFLGSSLSTIRLMSARLLDKAPLHSPFDAVAK